MKGGIWIHSFLHFGNLSNIERIVEKLKEANISLLIICVKNPDGLLDYHTKVGKTREEFKDWDPLEKLCSCASKFNLKVHAWLCVFTEGENSLLVEKYPSSRLITADGKPSTMWECAMRPEVQEYEYKLYEEILENYPVDGVHLDYIRTGDICYCEYCASIIKEKTGMEISQIKPNENGEPFEIWMKWREENITNFVRRVYEKAKKLNKEVSAAVFRNYPDCLQGQGQNWKDWAEKKIIDCLIPMNYTDNLTLFTEYSKIHKAIIGNKCCLMEGIGRKSSCSCLSFSQLENQIKVVNQLNLDGAVIFSYAGLKDKDFEIFKKYFS